MSTALPESPARAAPRWFFLLKLAIRLTVAGLVIWGVWYTVEKAIASLREENFALSDLAQLHAGWLAASAVLYATAMFPACWFWRKVLHAMGQDPPLDSTLRAYFIGNLGKYVPGKAMVVILRAGMVRGPAVDTTVAAVSVFVETLTLMAVGACFAAGLLATFHRHELWLLAFSVVLALGAGVPTLPPIFRRLVMLLQVKRLNPQIEQALKGIDWRLTAWGWLLMGTAWCLMGLSLWAVLKSIPDATVLPSHLPLLGATVALSMVAGFVSFIPAGLGVREVVVIPLLAPVYGNVVAIVSAILLRLVWLLSELATAGMVYVFTIPGGGKAEGRRDASAAAGAPD